jgi:hypothetical protein
MVPPPATNTERPSTSPARRIACSPIDSGSAHAISPSVISGSPIGVSCASPITMASRNRPCACGNTLALPRKNIERHRFRRPSRQKSQWPHACDGLIATLSPGFTCVTAVPTSATTPEASWPGTSGSRIWNAPTRPSLK